MKCKFLIFETLWVVFWWHDLGRADSRQLNAFFDQDLLAKCLVVVQIHHLMGYNKALILQNQIYLILHMRAAPVGFVIYWQEE